MSYILFTFSTKTQKVSAQIPSLLIFYRPTCNFSTRLSPVNKSYVPTEVITSRKQTDDYDVYRGHMSSNFVRWELCVCM